MKQTMHWQIVVPRVLSVIVIALAAQYGLGRIARSVAVGSLQSALDAHVESTQARVSLLDRQLVLGGLRFCSRTRPQRSVIEIDRCALDFSATPLLHKQTLIERGFISGLVFNLPALDAEAVDSTPAASASSCRWVDGGAADKAHRWLDSLENCFDQELVSQFESVEHTDQLCARLPAEAAEMNARIHDLKRRAAELQRSARAARVNPLRHVEFFNRLPEEVATLRGEFARTKAELDRLVQSVDTDRRKIVAARRQDEQLLRKELQLESLDAASLNAYLLREQLIPHVNQVVAALRWIRQVAPAKSAPPPRGKRGEELLFDGCRRTPSVIARNLQLRGNARIGGQPVEFRGMLTDVTNAPALHNRPIRLRLESQRTLPLQLQATIDRTGAVARDELLVDFRDIVMPKFTLGRPDEFRLTVAPSVGTLSVSVLVNGEKLSGDIQLVQKNLHVLPVFASELSDVPVASALKDTLSEIDGLATRISLGGTLSQPTCSLWSNLGPAVAEAMHGALKRGSDEHARTLLTRAHRRVDEQLAELERQMSRRQADLLSQIDRANGELESIAGEQSSTRRISREQLGFRLPNGSLFR
jgi:uncharacterized protein (TIGR03545 family)